MQGLFLHTLFHVSGEREKHESLESFIAWIKSYLTWETLIHFVIVILVVGILYTVYRLLIRNIKMVPLEKLSLHKSVMLQRFLKYAFIVLVGMYVFSHFGVKFSAIWGAAGIAGVAVAFAAQTTVSNLISGIFVLAEKTLKIADMITVGGETGIVDQIGLLSVRVHTLDNQMLRIPNSTIINSIMRNTSYFPVRRMSIAVSVSYDTDMETALNALSKAPALCPTVLADPAPAAWFDAFDESGINMTLAVWFNSADFLATKNAAFIAVKKVFDEAGIEIPYNKLDVKIYEDASVPAAKSKAVKSTKTDKSAVSGRGRKKAE